MRERIEELLARIRALQEEIEEEYRSRLEEFDRRRRELADEFLSQQRRYKIGLLRYLADVRPAVLLTVPLIYAGWLPFLAARPIRHALPGACFPIYGIPKAKRGDYVVFDREGLKYLNAIEKFNCFYCSYCNGVAAFVREVAARTEQYWCPIKHARRLRAPHERYPQLFDHGDAEAYRQGLERLREQYEDRTDAEN